MDLLPLINSKKRFPNHVSVKIEPISLYLWILICLKWMESRQPNKLKNLSMTKTKCNTRKIFNNQIETYLKVKIHQQIKNCHLI